MHKRTYGAMTLLVLREVAEVLRVSESTVRRWVRAGELPAYRIGPRGQLRVREEDVTAFLEGSRVPVGGGGMANRADEGEAEESE